VSETKRLGRGLEALLGPINRQEAQVQGALQELPVSDIRPNPYQPRADISEPAFQELVSSLRTSGLLQPIIVRPHHGGYQLIAGERRWRAAQKLGWTRIPAVVKEADDRTLLTLALVENLQRDDLSPIEAALSYQRLAEEFSASHQEIAEFVGKDRSTVANALRLLKLPDTVRKLVQDGQLSEGHARALLSLSDPAPMTRLAEEAVAQGWSVRELEGRVRDGRPKPRVRRLAPELQLSAQHRRVEDALRQRLLTDVRVTAKRRGRGLITISYYSNDDLARLIEMMLGHPFEG